MRIRYFFWVISLFILVVPNSFAAINDGLYNCWSFDSTNTTGSVTRDSGNFTNNMTAGPNANLDTTAGRCFSGQCYNFNNRGGLTTLANMSTEVTGNNPRTMSLRVKANTTNAAYIGGMGTNIDNQGFRLDYGFTVSERIDGVDGATGIPGFSNPYGWEQIALVWNGTNMTIWHNGTVVNGVAVGAQSTGRQRMTLGGTDFSGGFNFTGWIDETAIWNRALTSAEILSLQTTYTNCTSMTNPNVLNPSNPINITLTAGDLYDASAINTFWVSFFQGGVMLHNFSTTNGTIPVSNITNGIFNLTFSSPNYFDQQYFNVNVSGQNFGGQLYQAILYLNASVVGSGTAITNFNVSIPLQFNMSNSTGWAKLFLKAGTYSINGQASGFLNTTESFTLSALETEYNTLDFGTNLLRIDARSLINGAYISSFSVSINDGADYSASSSTTTGNITFPLVAGTYYMNFSSFSFARQNASIVVSEASIYPNYTFSVYTTNSINISIFDEIEGRGSLAFRNRTVNIMAISDYYSANYSTGNGFFYIDLLVPASYRLTLASEGYGTRDYYVDLNNGTNNQVEAFLLSTANGTLVTFTIKDNSGLRLENALVSLKRGYIVAGNQYQYLTVAQDKSDQEGKVVFDVDFNDAFYQLFSLYNTTTTNTIGAKIFSVDVTLFMDLLEDPFTAIDLNNNVNTALTYNNATGSFSYTFSNTAGTSVTGNLRVDRITSTGITTVCQTSGTSSSATILCNYNVTNQTGEYLATGYITRTGTVNQIITNTLSVVNDFRSNARIVFGQQGVLLSVIFGGGVAGLGAFNPAIAIVLFLSVLGFFVFSGFTYMSITIYVSIVIIGGAIVYKLRT